MRALATAFLAERRGRIGGWRLAEATVEGAVRRTSAKLLQHYGSMARFAEGGVRADRDERATRLLEKYLQVKPRSSGERVR